MPIADGLWYDWAGNPAGEVLVLSAGLGGSASYWQPNLAALGRDYRILLYDHRGTGRSDRALPAAVTVDGLAADIRILLDAAGVDRAHVMGHAAGAVAGLALALNTPARLGKLVAVNGWCAPDPHFARCFDARLALLRASGPAAYLRAQPIFLFPAPWISEHHKVLEAEFAHQLAGFAGAESFEKRIAALRAFDISDRLGEIAAPVLALASHDDMLVPWTASERLVAGLSDAALAVMPWGGHACNVTDPDSFNRIVLDFLRS